MAIEIIYKERLRVQGREQVRIPLDAVIIKVAEQDGHLHFWYKFEVEPASDEPVKGYHERSILIFGTGHLIEPPDGEDWRYIDTVLCLSGPWVWHVYEVITEDMLDA